MRGNSIGFRLAKRERRVLEALLHIVCDPAEAGRRDPASARTSESASAAAPVVDHVEATLAAFSPGQRRSVLLSLRAFELLAILHPPFRRPFSRMPSPAARDYYRSWWASKYALRRSTARMLKMLLVLAYYEQPAAQHALAYDPSAWIAQTAARRLQLWSAAIAQHEAILLAPDPLVPARGRGATRASGRLHTFHDFRGGILECDVVVVGSGAGGGVIAAELAEGGLQVIVLEEGGYHPSEEFSADATAMVRTLYRDGGGQTTIGTPAISFSEGRCVGGSTTINGGMCWRTPERVLRCWRDGHGVDAILPEQMDRYFTRVERFVSAAPQDPDSIGRDQELLRLGAERQGWRTLPTIRNQLHCCGCNNCILGCPTGAKRSTLVSYIPRAISFGAHVFADCHVERITMHGKRAVGVSGWVETEDGRRGASFTVQARRVVLAAGAIQSPALLLRSGVHSPSRRIGHNLSLHPNAAVTAVFGEEVEGWKGVHQAYQVREFQDDGIIMAAINLPPAFLAMAIDSYGPTLAETMRHYSQIVSAGVLVEDTAAGRVRLLPNGRPAAFYRLSARDAKTLVRATALLSELLFAAGARRISVPFQGMSDLRSGDDARRLQDLTVAPQRMNLSTVHVMGTACMGADSTRHVCDSYGQVYGTDALYVADASLFPSPIGINPMETIMALATRNAERILETWRR